MIQMSIKIQQRVQSKFDFVELLENRTNASYRKLHGSRSIDEKSHACLAKCL